MDVAVIAVLDITEESHGNIAAGSGQCDHSSWSRRSTGWPATPTDTSGIFGMYRNALPITMPNDRQTLNVAMLGCAVPPAEAHGLHARHAHTEPSLRQPQPAQSKPTRTLTIAGEVPLQFDDNG
ncbi:MAG: hypothetical protein R3A10_03445 [Caldilineaceae bacterium]